MRYEMRWQRTDVVVIMGGLGPTEDDLTREAVAEAMQIGLKRDPELIAQLYARAAALRWTITRNNEKQADVLDGAVILKNPRGSAPGQWLDVVYGKHRKLVMLLPGPPSELKPMFDEECVPRLREALPQRFIATRVLKAALIGESAADARIAPIYTQFTDVETTILAHLGDIQLNLLCSKPILELAQARVDALAEKIEEELEDLIYSSQGETLEQIVLLLPRNAGRDAIGGGKLHGRAGGGAADEDQREFAVVHGRRGGVQQRTEDGVRGRGSGADCATRRGEPRGGGGAGGGYPRAVRYDLRARSDGHCRAFGRE